MKFSDLYACSKCGVVFVFIPDDGRCRLMREYLVSGSGLDTVCGGAIRPINYKPPTKDPRQCDIEEYTAPPTGRST